MYRSTFVTNSHACVYINCLYEKIECPYTNDQGIIKQSFAFKEDNKVEFSSFGIDIEGEYFIEDDKITTIYSFLILVTTQRKALRKRQFEFFDETEIVKE